MSPEKAKKEFDILYAKWEKAIQDPSIQCSSRPEDYTNIKPYKDIIRLGKAALPYILEKIESGSFLMNEAALKIAKVSAEDIVEEEKKRPASKRASFVAAKMPEFLSEQQKSILILKHFKAK